MRCRSPDSATQSRKVRAQRLKALRLLGDNGINGNVCVVVSKSKVVIFGGATGDTGKYIITGDTYALDLISSKWSKLEGKSSQQAVLFRPSIIKLL